MKRNTKQIIATLSVAALASAGLATGLAYGLGGQKEENKIILSTSNEDIVLDEETINFMEDVAEVKLNSMTSYTDGEEGGETPPDGEETPEAPPEAGRQSIKQLTADWLQIGFFNSALTGDWRIHEADGTETIVDTVLTGKTDEWSSSGYTVGAYSTKADYQNLYSRFVEAKVYKDSTGAGKDIYVYLSEKAAEDFQIAQVVNGYIDPSYKTIWDIQNNEIVAGDYQKIIDVLGESLSFQKEITPVMYMYSYLWQESNSNEVYDYKITEKLASNRAAFTWTVNVEEVRSGSLWNKFNGQNIEIQDNWNSFATGEAQTGFTGDADLLNHTSGNEDSVDKDGRMGFEGLTFQSTSAHTEENLWKFDSHQTYSETATETTVATPTINALTDEFTNDVLLVEPAADTGKLVLYQEVMPYSFAEGWDGEAADKYTYSLFGDDQGADVVTSADTKNAGRNIFTDLATNPIGDSDDMEAWLFYSLINNSKEEIEKEAYAFWKSKGFSIELTGEYEDDYGSLIHKGIQR